MSTVITSIDRHSPAARAGIKTGETLLEINGHIIEDVLDYPGNQVYVVRGENEYLIAAVKAFVYHTDLDANRMDVTVIEGMRSDED